MTRIENEGAQDRESLKKQIREEIRSEERKKGMRHVGGCALALLLVLGVPTVYVASVIAETGLVNVPVLTALLFKPSTPSRIVLPLVGEKPEQIFPIIATRASYDPTTSFLTFSVHEDELTTVVSDAIAKAPPGTLPFPMKDAQIAIDDNDAEMFARIIRDGRDTTLLVRFRPVVAGGQLTADVSLVQLGSLTLPHWAASALVDSIGKSFLSPLQTNIAAIGTLQKVVLQKGLLQLVIKTTPH